MLRSTVLRWCLRCHSSAAAANRITGTGAHASRACSSTPITTERVEGPALVLPMPKLSHEMTDGTITKWLKHEGERVAMYDLLLEVTTGNLVEDAYATGDFEGDVTLLIENNEDDGVLAKVLVAEGEKVPVGTPIALFCDETGDVEAARSWQVPTQNVYDEHGQARVRVLEWQSYLKESKKETAGEAPSGGCM